MLINWRPDQKKRPFANTGTKEDGNETAFTHGCSSNASARSAFGSHKIDAAHAAFVCEHGRMEMQQLGIDSNHLRAGPRPLKPDQLTSSSLRRLGRLVPTRGIESCSAV